MDKIEEILEAYKRLPAPDQYKVAENILNMEEESKSGFDTNNMRSDLEEVCHNRETCNYCPIKDEFGIVDCDFEEMADKKIVEIYDKILEGNRVEKKFYRLNLLDEANMYFFVNATIDILPRLKPWDSLNFLTGSPFSKGSDIAVVFRIRTYRRSHVVWYLPSLWSDAGPHIILMLKTETLFH